MNDVLTRIDNVEVTLDKQNWYIGHISSSKRIATG